MIRGSAGILAVLKRAAWDSRALKIGACHHGCKLEIRTCSYRGNTKLEACNHMCKSKIGECNGGIYLYVLNMVRLIWHVISGRLTDQVRNSQSKCPGSGSYRCSYAPRWKLQFRVTVTVSYNYSV